MSIKELVDMKKLLQTFMLKEIDSDSSGCLGETCEEECIQVIYRINKILKDIKPKEVE